MIKQIRNEYDWAKINYTHLLGKFNKGFLLMDQEGIIIEANEATFKIFGRKLLIGKPFISFVNNDELMLFAKNMQQLIIEDESEITTTLNLTKESGDQTTVRLFATLTEQLNLNAIIMFLESIEEIKTLEDELKSVSHALDMFAYMASHELKGPIATIQGLCNVISLQKKREVNDLIALIVKECKKMDSKVKKLSETTTLKKENEQPVLIDFNQIINNVINGLKLFLNFNVQLENSLQYNFYSSPVYIKAIFYHLLENAKRFRKRDKSLNEILINLYEEKNIGIYIEIKDTGIGIQTNELCNIFDIFYKGDCPYTGSGIGLYLVKNIVQRLKGEVKVDSELNYYTSISIFLPFSY